MTMMRRAFNGDGRHPNLFESEKNGVNQIMDIIDKNLAITEYEINQIQSELDIVENSIHYGGSAWFDFKLHLNGLLLQIAYEVEFGENNKILSIKKSEY